MGKVIATVTTSLDGYVAGPADGPGCGLGIGGERLHYWMMGGPWTYDAGPDSADGVSGEDKAFLDETQARLGGSIVGRAMYEAGEAWGGSNPFHHPLVVLTHHPEDQPPAEAGFHFVDGFDAALAAARELAGDKDIALAGGPEVIRQGLEAGIVDELAVSTAPVILGAGKRLFAGFEQDLDLVIRSVRHSAYATHVVYAVTRV